MKFRCITSHLSMGHALGDGGVLHYLAYQNVCMPPVRDALQVLFLLACHGMDPLPVPPS